jgi:hypothetical protein
MTPETFLGLAALVGGAVGYLIGRSVGRDLERAAAARRSAQAIAAVDAMWENALKVVHRLHGVAESALLSRLEQNATTIRDLRDALDRTAIPRERN